MGPNNLSLAVPPLRSWETPSLDFGSVPKGVCRSTDRRRTAKWKTTRFGIVAATSTFDFGDAPNSYGTTLAANGARHAVNGPFLRISRDADD